MSCILPVFLLLLCEGLLFAQADPREACAADVQKLCPNVPQGSGRILACLKQHQDQVSATCKQAVLKALQPSGSTPAPAIPAPTPSPAAQPKNPSPAPAASAAPSDRYFLMKQVKIIDQGMGQGRPAYDLLIPSTWNFKGWVNAGVAEGGCFADWFSVFGDATSPDNSIELQLLPQSTWQYMDDPVAQRQMQQQNQRDAQAGMKPCPVHAPFRAEEFIRQNLIPKGPKNSIVVSIDSFPELDQIVRHQLGLPPASTGGNSGGIRTEAARARMAYNDDNGKPTEAWLTAAMVVRSVPAGGRGASYDSHAMMVLFFRAPKGQLDSNDRLFKLMAATVHPEPEWRNWSNGVISTLYRKKQAELAKQGAMIAEFQRHVADTINGVTANSMAGANRAAFGQDQIIRGVQTFRDPSTGATFELSNQYDHAWLNGTNEYVMTGDPNFNPNGNLDGNWSKLELVRQQP